MTNSDEALQETLERSVARHNVAGASVAVLSAGRVSTAAAGKANLSTGVTFTPDTIMQIGSITKVFNATLVMQLVDEGLVDLSEAVRRYLPDLRLRDRDALERISVGMLLNHTSGIDGEMLPDHGHDEETIEKGIARFSELGQLFEPGTEFSYSNAATVVAGYLVQRIRGKSWYSLVKERILEPLQLEQTATLPEEAILQRAAVGHYLDAKHKLTRVSFAFLPMSFGPCGTSLMASASDLITFARAHMAGGIGLNGSRILSEASARAMQRIGVSNKDRGYASTDGMGIGWMVSESGTLNHGGGCPGIVAWLYVQPKREFAAAVLVNSSHGISVINELVEPWLSRIKAGKPVGMIDVPVPAVSAEVDYANYVGTYEDVFTRYRISVQSGGLRLSEQNKWASYNFTSTHETSPVLLAPLGRDRFLLAASDHTDAWSNADRICEFRNPSPDGKMLHLGRSLRLYRRTS